MITQPIRTATPWNLVDGEITGNRSGGSAVAWSMTTAALSLPAQLGNYELVRLLAKGGMADIYLARQRGIGKFERHVAVKVLSAARAKDHESCSLFLDEARLLAMLNHPNLASVHEVAAEGGMHYLAMEYVHGVDLRVLMQTADVVAYQTAVAIVLAAAAGLDHAHRRCGPDGKPMHLVHRDVSLSNIMITYDGSVKVVDFGIATASVSSHHTNPGVVRGKASYMSPEQALGDPVDLRTDVFALGIVLYELTTGRRCFSGTSDFERMLAAVRGEYKAPEDAIDGFPPTLANVIATCLAIDPAHRFASAAALIEALEQVAYAEGWIVGASVIADLMHDHYGDVREPWAHTVEITSSAIVDEAPVTAVHDIAPAPQPTRVITRRRLASGTCAEPLLDDDQPTRGRRSVPKIFSAQFAA
jgi:eukaryotic-like serine/threonine-protein kinase